MKTEIIATVLPRELANAMPSSGALVHYLVCKHLEQAQRDAILRFVKATQAKSQELLETEEGQRWGSFWCYTEAARQLRDELAKEK